MALPSGPCRFEEALLAIDLVGPASETYQAHRSIHETLHIFSGAIDDLTGGNETATTRPALLQNAVDMVAIATLTGESGY